MDAPALPVNLATIDFEACGLGPGTWPIEVGWMRWSDETPKSLLIKPHPTFDRALWMPKSQSIHGLSLEKIERDGIDVSDVLDALRADLDGYMVVSDAPTYDGAWFDMLWTRVADCAPFKIVDLLDAFLSTNPSRLQYSAMVIGYIEWMEHAGHPPHRAGPDAERLMNALKAALGGVA